MPPRHCGSMDDMLDDWKRLHPQPRTLKSDGGKAPSSYLRSSSRAVALSARTRCATLLSQRPAACMRRCLRHRAFVHVLRAVILLECLCLDCMKVQESTSSCDYAATNQDTRWGSRRPRACRHRFLVSSSSHVKGMMQHTDGIGRAEMHQWRHRTSGARVSCQALGWSPRRAGPMAALEYLQLW
jgi:hypothetical protein